MGFLKLQLKVHYTKNSALQTFRQTCAPPWRKCNVLFFYLLYQPFNICNVFLDIYIYCHIFWKVQKHCLFFIRAFVCLSWVCPSCVDNNVEYTEFETKAIFHKTAKIINNYPFATSSLNRHSIHTSLVPPSPLLLLLFSSPPASVLPTADLDRGQRTELPSSTLTPHAGKLASW